MDPSRRQGAGLLKVLGGVCGGLAEYSGVEPVLWRVGFIVLNLFGPGIVSYPLLWVVMPPDPGGPRWPGRLRQLQLHAEAWQGADPQHTDS
ncbi:PspC domain-containing protein [Streptomyces sp.]|jgi:phage shock protein PspC (stress-responsive transcriptional regulator)|uniref:PspC domain-containing protein n=1 Tax=Streptomyces sp. TaxID=1931 RepID=UPI0039C99F33